MKHSIEKAVRDLGVIRIDNLVSMEYMLRTDGLCSKEFALCTGCFLCLEQDGMGLKPK
jgi:hypothetical protein